VKAVPWMMAVPVFAQTLLLGDLLKGDWPHPAWLAGAALSTALAAALCLAVTVRLLGDERIVYGRTQSQ
jgi:hypothetical protein